MQMGLFSKTAMCSEVGRVTWGGLGEVMPGFCSTTPP